MMIALEIVDSATAMPLGPWRSIGAAGSPDWRETLIKAFSFSASLVWAHTSALGWSSVSSHWLGTCGTVNSQVVVTNKVSAAEHGGRVMELAEYMNVVRLRL